MISAETMMRSSQMLRSMDEAVQGLGSMATIQQGVIIYRTVQGKGNGLQQIPTRLSSRVAQILHKFHSKRYFD